ncbi:MAG: heptose kinase [Piscirickettsiaceae bacterium]|nr:heptose kinase [Piscirickettsiaceae bacterium]
MAFIKKKWTVFPPWNKTSVATHFSSMDEVFKLESTIISKSPQSEIFAHTIEGKTYFVKRYFRSKGLASWLGFSRLRVEARNQRRFKEMQIPAASVVAYGEQSLLSKTLKGVLITEGVENVTELVEIANGNPEKFQQARWRNAIISQLAQIITTLHKNRFCHNDLHWRNILIQQNEQNAEPKIYLIDCPSGKRLWWPFLYYRKLKDLASLDKLAPIYLTRTQRLKFYLEYRQITKLSNEDKIIIKGVFARKASRLKRKIKKIEATKL